MNNFEYLVKKRENLLGSILQKDVVKKENKVGKVVVTFKKKHKAKEFYGMLSDWKIPTSELKHEMKKGWE